MSFSLFVSFEEMYTLQHIFIIIKLCFADIRPAGILNHDGTLNNDASCLRLAEVALAYAQAGKSGFQSVCNLGKQLLK